MKKTSSPSGVPWGRGDGGGGRAFSKKGRNRPREKGGPTENKTHVNDGKRGRGRGRGEASFLQTGLLGIEKSIRGGGIHPPRRKNAPSSSGEG